MKGQANTIETFWKEDLSVYVAKHTTPIAPHAVPHLNYAGTML